jgi:hypothetical protein
LAELKQIAGTLNSKFVRGGISNILLFETTIHIRVLDEAKPLKLAIDELISAGKLVLAGRKGSMSCYCSTKLFVPHRAHFEPPTREVATKQITYKVFRSLGPTDIGSGMTWNNDDYRNVN